MSKHFRITLAIIGTLVALALGAVGVMSTNWFRQALERRLIVELEEITGGRVEVGEFGFHPVALQAFFHGLVLHGSEPSTAPALFSARGIVLRLSPTNLLHRQVRIASLDWEGAEVHLRTNPDGTTNLPGPMVGLHAGQFMRELIDLRIGRVTLAHSTFYWDNRALPMDLSARDVALLVHFRTGRRYEGNLVASAVTLRNPVQTLPPLAFSARFALTQNEVAVTSFAWQFRGVNGQGSFNFRPLPEPVAYFSFETGFELSSLNPLFHLSGLRNGSVRLEGQGIYRHGEVSARGRVYSRQLLFRDAQFDIGPLEAWADFAADHSRLAISNLRVLGWGGSAQGEGQVGLAGPAPEFHFRARAQNLNAASLLQSTRGQPRFIAQLRPESRVDGTIELAWSGEFEKMKSKFDLHFSPFETPAPGTLPLSGEALGTLETNHGLSVNLSDASLRTPHSVFRAKGTLVESTAHGEAPSRLEIQLETTQFEEWRSLLETQFLLPQHVPLMLESAATLIGEVTGSRTSPQIRGAVRVGKFEYRGWRWDSLQANVAASPDSLAVSSGELSRAGSVLLFEASTQLAEWRFSKSSPLRLAARAERTPMDGLKAVLGITYPVGGMVSGQANLSGTDTNLDGTGNIRVEAGNIAGENFNSFSAGIRIQGSAWRLDSIELVKSRGKITGSAQLDVSQRSLSCRLHGSNFSLADFRNLAVALPKASGAVVAGATAAAAPVGQEGRSAGAMEGQASFDLEGSASPDHLHFHSSALVQAMHMAGVEVGDLHIQLEGEGHDIQFRGISSGSAGTFSLNGDAQAAGDWPLELEGQFLSFRLDPWTGVLLNNNLDAQVTATGSFKGNGPLRDPSKLDLHSRIDTLEVSFPTVKWRNALPIQLRYADHQLTAERFRMQGPSTNLDVEGSLGLARAPSLSLDLQGVSDATILRLLEPGLRTSGQARIKLNVSGSPARPQMNGVVEVRDVDLDYPGLPIRLGSLNGEIQLEGERATLKSLRGVSGGGTVTLDGFMTVALNPRVELRAQLDQIRARYPAEFTSVLSGSLRFEGTADRSQLRGDLSVTQVLAGENKPWLNQIMQSANPFEAPAPATTSSLANSVRLNIRVATPTPVQLQVQDLRLTADIDVRLQGSLANPVETGTVHFLNGEAIVRGNRFRLTRGDLNMSNPLRTQATLDLEAQTRVQQYDLTVDVTGPLGRLKMTYRSDPPLPTPEVFSLLALGYAPQQQQGSASGLVSSFAAGNPTQTVGESALLSQALSTQVGGRIQRLFGVSRIQIDPNVGLPGLNNGERVTIEQQVTKDLTLTYTTNTASSQYQIIQFEYAFGDNISLLGIRDPNGIVGVELRFRRRFK